MESQKKDKNNKKQKYFIAIGILVLISIVSIIGLLFMNRNNNAEEKELAYTNLIKEIN